MDFDITRYQSPSHNHSHTDEWRSSQQRDHSPTTGSLMPKVLNPLDKNVSIKEESVVEHGISLRQADDIRLAELGSCWLFYFVRSALIYDRI